MNDSPRPAGTARSAPDGLLPALPNTDLKLAMAASGALFSGYVLVHMLGNLKVYQGAQKFDAYAELLRTAGAPVLPRGTVLWTEIGRASCRERV